MLRGLSERPMRYLVNSGEIGCQSMQPRLLPYESNVVGAFHKEESAQALKLLASVYILDAPAKTVHFFFDGVAAARLRTSMVLRNVLTRSEQS